MRALILHGTNSDHNGNWFPWLKTELQKLGYEVWVPDLPVNGRPSVKRYNEFLLSQGWDFSDNLIVGHSSGAVAILGLLQALPQDTKINTAVLAGAFTKKLSEDPNWENLNDLFDEPFDYQAIKQKAKQFIFVHSKDDPYCPVEQAEELCRQINGEFIRLDGMKHFSISLDKRFTEFPKLLDIIKQKVHH